MKATFKRALALVLVHEGGHVDHPRDPGGATNRGITHRTLAAWRGKRVTKADVRALGMKETGDIYRARYWDSLRCDALPAGLDYAVFDYGVNSGIGRAARELQRLVGAKADGIIGGMTLKAVSRHDPQALIVKLCNKRTAFLKGLKTWRTFGRGWSSRVSGVRKHALEMADA